MKKEVGTEDVKNFLDQQAADLPSDVSSSLDNIRQKAIQEIEQDKNAWLGGMLNKAYIPALAASLLIAVVVVINQVSVDIEGAGLTPALLAESDIDLEMLSEDIEMLQEDLDFYLWLEEIPG